MNKKEIYLQIEKHKEDMLKSDVQYWIKRYDIKYQQNKENYDKLKECEQQLQAYKDKEEKLREYLKKVRNKTFKIGSNEWNVCLSYNDDVAPILQILNEGSDK